MRIALAEILANKGDPAATNMMLGVPYYNVAIFGSGIPTAPGTVETPRTR